MRRRSLLLLIPLLVLAAACRERPARAGVLAYRDDWGRRVALAAPARRIVSLSPTTTELLFTMGLGARLVGRTHWYDWPAEARAVPDVGDGLAPNVEAVAAQRPDLVLMYASEANRGALERLEALHIGVAVLKLDRAEDLRHAAIVAGTLAGQMAAADSFIARFDRDVAAAGAANLGRPRVRVYVDVEPNPPITVGGGSYLSLLLGLAGAVNVFDDVAAPSAPVSLETIVARNPDVVVTLGGSDAASRLTALGGWSAVRAVREHRVIALDPSLFGRLSPRLPEAVRVLAADLRRVGQAR